MMLRPATQARYITHWFATANAKKHASQSNTRSFIEAAMHCIVSTTHNITQHIKQQAHEPMK